MGAHDLLAAIRAAGLTPTVVDGRLRVTGPTNALDHFRPAIREYRDRLVLELNGAATVAGEHATSDTWLIHYPDREPLEVATCPPATHVEILEQYPDALAAEPFTPIVRPPASSMTGDEERAVLRWLDLIGETNSATIAEVLTACRCDIKARRYFLERAEWQPSNKTTSDCGRCGHRRSPGGMVRHCASGRTDLPPAYGAGHPQRRLPDDHGHCSSQWSGLIQKGVE